VLSAGSALTKRHDFVMAQIETIFSIKVDFPQRLISHLGNASHQFSGNASHQCSGNASQQYSLDGYSCVCVTKG
jgi:hypothetical protein